MASGYYAACTALMSRARALETIADNMANASTSGYRGRHNVFQSMLARTEAANLSPLNQAINQFGVLGSTRLDLTQGTLERTGNEQDLGLEGPGYFAVQTTGGTVYTRSGNFHVDLQNHLVTEGGDPVLGKNGPVTVVGAPLAVSPDGTLSVSGAVVGQLDVVEFPAGTQLESLGSTYYAAPAGLAKAAESTRVRQGMVESSNVNPVNSVAELITVQREAEMMQRVLAMINSDINKVAAQELPRVSG